MPAHEGRGADQVVISRPELELSEELLAHEQHQRVFPGVLEGPEVYRAEVRAIRDDRAELSERLWPMEDSETR